MQFDEGDEVYVIPSGYGSMRKGTVARVTKTQAVVSVGDREEKYNRETGRVVGGSQWNHSRIEHPSATWDKRYADEQAEQLLSRLERAARNLRNKKATAADVRRAFEAWDRASGGSTEDGS